MHHCFETKNTPLLNGWSFVLDSAQCTIIPCTPSIAGSEDRAGCASQLHVGHVVQPCCNVCCEGDCSYCTGECRLCSTARMCRSIEVRQEVMGLCGRGFRLRCGRCPTLLCSTEGGADVGSPTCLHRHAVHGTGPRACRRGRTGSCPPPCVASPARGMWCTEKPQ